MSRLYGLDALRGIAAALVFIHHVRAIFHLPGLDFGALLAVDLFFMLSGFVMARTYDAKLESTLSPVGFIGIRYRRLWLPLAIGALIGFGLELLRDGLTFHSVFELAALWLFLPAPGWFALNQPAWSIFVEVTCNLTHALLRRTGLLLACLAVSAAIFIVSTIEAGHVIHAADAPSTLLSVARGLTSYLIGVMLYRRFGDAPLASPVIGIGGFPVALLAGAYLLPPWALALVAVFVLFPLVIRSSLGLGVSKLATVAGALSFPLYAIHVPALWVFRVFGLSVAWAAVWSLALAAAITLLFEVRRQSSKDPKLFRNRGSRDRGGQPFGQAVRIADHAAVSPESIRSNQLG